MRWLLGAAIIFLLFLEAFRAIFGDPIAAMHRGRLVTIQVIENCGSALEKPGIYMLTQDCSGKGPWLFDIKADNVTFDLAGHTMRCDPDKPSTSTMMGIKAVYAQHFRVSNGKITGCHTALDAGHGHAVTVANLDISGTTHIGVNLGGSDNQVLDSQFANIGNDTPGGSAIAILGPGARSIVAGNTIKNVGRQKLAEPSPAADGIGILVTAISVGAFIFNNTMALDRPNATTSRSGSRAGPRCS